MTPPLLTRAARLALAAAALLVPVAAVAPAGAVSASASCAAVRTADPAAPDGEYAITVHGRTVTVYCADMATTPLEYLTLPMTGPTTNVSSGGSAQRHFQRVRLLLPASAAAPFAISTADVRFSTAPLGQPTSYGYALGCYFVPVNANVDLRGTPFGVSAASFTRSGTAPQGTAVSSAGGQVLDLVGVTGDCGSYRAGPTLPLLWLASAPAVVTGPADVTAVAGADATFTVAASGNPAPTVRWESSTDGATFTTVAGATSATLVLPAVALGSSGLVVRAVLENEQGTVTSAGATLTVVPAPPTVTDPTDTSVTWGDDAVFTVVAAGDPAPTLAWERSTDGVTWTTVAGATGAQLVLADVTAADDGARVRAVATGPGGVATSAPALLTVTASAPTIVAAPAPVTVVAGQPATFTVTVSGSPTPSVQWQTSADGVAWTSVPGATGTAFTVADADVPLSGLLVRVVVTSAGGTVTSAASLLTVTPAPLAAPVVTPVAAPAAAPVAAAAPAAPAGAAARLATTGADATAPLALAGVMLLAGCAAVVGRRRLVAVPRR